MRIKSYSGNFLPKVFLWQMSLVLSLLLVLELPLYAGGFPVGFARLGIQNEILQFKQKFIDRDFYLTRDHFSPPSTSKTLKPICILIGDAHGNREAQNSIFRFVEWLRGKQPDVLFLVEGVHDELDLRAFQHFSEAAREKITHKWFEHGELSPIESSFLIHPEAGRISGLEGSDLYEKNVKTYWQAKENEKLAKPVLDNLFQHTYLKLSKTFQLEFLKFNSFESFLSSLERSPERTIELFAEVMYQIPLENLQDFQNRFPVIYPFFGIIQQMISKPNQPLKSELKEWFEDSEVTARLSEEYPKFYEFLMKHKASHSHKKLAVLWTVKPAIEHFISLEASPDDLLALREFEKNDGPAKTLLINKRATSPEVKALIKQLGLSERFYQLARERDAIFRKRFHQVVHAHPNAKAIVVIAGGFHLDPFRQFLEEKRYQYIVMKPKMERPSESDYETQMRKLASLFASTVVLPWVTEEPIYEMSGLPLTGRFERLRREMEKETLSRSELRAEAQISRRDFFRVTGKALVQASVVGFAAGCASEKALNWNTIPKSLESDNTPRKADEIVLVPGEIQTALQESNPLILQRLQIYRAYLEYLKTLPEFANVDLNLAFQTQIDKIIASNIHRMSKKEQFVRTQVSKLATTVIGAGTGKVSAALAERNKTLGDVATALGDALSQKVSNKVIGSQPDSVNYDAVLGDLGIAMNLVTSPALSALDTLADYLEKNPAVPLVSLNTPFGFTLGPSSGNIAQASHNQQVVLNLVLEMIRYRKILNEQARAVSQLYQAMEALNLELLRLMTDAHLATLQIEQFRSLRSATSKQDIKRLELEVGKTSHLINIQLRAISILQGSINLMFSRSPRDLRNWIVETGGGERSVFTTANNLNKEPIRGMDHLRKIPFMKFEENIYHLDPVELPDLVDSLIQKGVLAQDADTREWFLSWGRHQTSLRGGDIPREQIRQAGKAALEKTFDTSETDEQIIQISLTEEGIRQLNLLRHSEVTFGVDSSFTASPINHTGTLTWSIPLTVAFRFPLSTRNTQVSMKQGKVDVEVSRILIDQARNARASDIGTFLDTITQTEERIGLFTKEQARHQILLGKHGREVSDYSDDAAHPVPAQVKSQFYDLVRAALDARFQLHSAEIDNGWSYRQLGLLLNDNKDVRGPEYPKSEIDQLDPNVKQMVELGLESRSELRKIENESAMIQTIEERLNLYADELPPEGEILFSGNRLEFKKTSHSVQLVKANLPLLKHFDISFILILVEERLHELALHKHSENQFEARHNKDYALFQDTLVRIVKRLFLEKQHPLLSRFSPEPESDFMVLRVLKKTAAEISEKGMDKRQLNDGEILSVLWPVLKAEADQPKRATNPKRVILVPNSQQVSEKLAEQTKPVIHSYRTTLYGAAGISESFFKQHGITPVQKEGLLKDPDVVDAEQRGILRFVRESASQISANAIELLRYFKLDEVRDLVKEHQIPIENLNEEALALYRRGDHEGLQNFRGRIGRISTASVEDNVHLVRDAHPEPASTGIISLEPVHDDLELARTNSESDSKPQRRTGRGNLLRILSLIVGLVLPLSIAFTSPVIGFISQVTSKPVVPKVSLAPQPDIHESTAASRPAAPVWKKEVTPPQVFSKPVQKPWFADAGRTRIELNPKAKDLIRNRQISVSKFLETLGMAKSIQVVLSAVSLPDTLTIHDDGRELKIDWEEALAQLANRFESIKEKLAAEDPGFVEEKFATEDPESKKSESQLLPVPWNLKEWLQTIRASQEALVRVAPFRSGDQELRSTTIPWNQLVSDVFLGIARAERELDTFLRGDSSSGDFRTILVDAYKDLRALAEAMEYYQNLELEFIPTNLAQHLILNTTNFSFFQPASPGSPYSVVLKADENVPLTKLTLLLKLKNGTEIKIKPNQLNWARLGNQTYLGLVTSIEQIDLSPGVASTYVESAEPNVAGSNQDDAAEPQFIRVPNGFKVDLKVNYFQEVKAGDLIAEVYDPSIPQKINELKNRLSDLQNARRILSDNLPFISSNVFKSEKGASHDQLAKAIAGLNAEIESLEQSNANRIQITAEQSGIFLPPNVSHSPQVTTNENLLGFISPVMVEKQDALRSELRYASTVALLRALISADQPPHANRVFGFERQNSPFSDAVNSAREREVWTKSLKRYPIPVPAKQFLGSTQLVQTADTLLVTDFGAFSYDGFKNWKAFLPSSRELHWMIVASSKEASSVQFRSFLNELHALGYFPTIVRTREEALRQIARQSHLWKPNFIKWITSSEISDLNLNNQVSDLSDSSALIVKFNSRVYREIEPLFYKLILQAVSAQELTSQFQSIESNKSGSWTVLAFNFNQLLVQFSTGQTLSHFA